ncbi:hypothetical protein [Tenacibaculum sp. 190524A05c]|uniref:Alpha/beta hydrolase n=1 Tax=Tenacibaculum platacis TaxID=3137852 RepID=A0ABP1ECV0_9FLAO
MNNRKIALHLFLFLGFSLLFQITHAQETIEEYSPLQKDSIQIGNGEKDFFPFIQRGYTLHLPKSKEINGTLIFFEDSGIDKKNISAKQLYKQANKKGFAVLSVSTEIPFDFYFSENSIRSAHEEIQKAFAKHKLPNKNIFFLGASLTGHRAMRYIKVSSDKNYKFQLNTKGIVICNFTLDWTRKWHQHEREIRIQKNNLWEPKFINYMLETHLGGTPETQPEKYHEFSAYSFFDKENRNISVYKNLAIRAYVEPAIKYKLTKQYRTLYENNTTDLVGFLAEQRLAGNEKTELIVFQPEDNPSKKKNVQSTWNAIDKKELMDWILKQICD